MPPTLNILVLGDSALSSLGAVFDNAFDCIEREHRWSREVCILDASIVGMTAPDAWVHCVETTRRQHIDGIILYLGNCDACAYGHLKPRTAFWLDGLLARARNRSHERRNPMTHRNRPFHFAAHDPLSNDLRRCVSPADHLQFIDRIVAHAAARRIHVFVVRPVSKRDFPPCNNTGNFLFYKIAGVADEHPYPGGGAASRLVEALHSHAAGRFDEALALYAEIGAAHPGQEPAWIAANNAAVIHGERGDPDAAAGFFATVPAGGNPMHAIVLFNQAVLARARGDLDEAAAAFEAAREADTGTYRITAAYRRPLPSRIGTGSEYVHEIDLGPSLGDADFIDYCHPTEAGHRKLASHLATTLESAFHLSSGEHRPRVTFLGLDPDRYTGARGGFFERFGIVVHPDPTFGARILAAAEAAVYSELLEQDALAEPDAAARTRMRILAHPLYGSAAFLRGSPPLLHVDQGQLPELYFLRHMLAIYSELQRDPRLQSACGGVERLLPKTARIAVWGPALGLEPVSLPALREIAARLDTNEILARTTQFLRRVLAGEPRLFSRYRTISYWFLRESLLFGTTSHPSMFYDRLGLQNVANTCLFLLWHASDGSPLDRQCRRLLQLVDATLEVHARHLEPWADRIYAMPSASLAAHRADLEALRQLPELAVHPRPPVGPQSPAGG